MLGFSMKKYAFENCVQCQIVDTYRLPYNMYIITAYIFNNLQKCDQKISEYMESDVDTEAKNNTNSLLFEANKRVQN